MSSPSPSLRKRGGKKEAYTAVPSDDGSLISVAPAQKSEWDYWLAMVILTVLAFATRFYRIDYPNEVVFDEVHFGKVRINALVALLPREEGVPRADACFLVRFLLSSTYLFLRRAPAFWKAAICSRGLASGL